MENPLPFLIKGVQEDCETLLLEFEKLETVRFSDFARLWKEKKFSLIFGNRLLTEMDLFVPEVLKLVKNYFIRGTSFNMKVGALYLLYGLYYKQPLKGYKKILVTHNDWIVIQEFTEGVRSTNHYDTLLIISQLIVDNAFSWSVLPSRKKYFISENVSNYGLFETNSLLGDVEFQHELVELKDIEQEYEIALKNVIKLDTDKNKILLNYSKNDFCDDLYKILHSKEGAEQHTEVEQTNSLLVQEGTTDIGSRRRALKNRTVEK